MKPSFSAAQKKLLLTCLAVYTSAYFCRLNLSAALSGIMDAFSLSMAQGGMLQTVFAAGAAYEGAMPGQSAKECGNYRNLDVALARQCCAFYAEVIAGWTVEKLSYPES